MTTEKDTPDPHAHYFRTDGSFGRRQRVIRDRYAGGDSIEHIAEDIGAPIEVVRRIVSEVEGAK